MLVHKHNLFKIQDNSNTEEKKVEDLWQNHLQTLNKIIETTEKSLLQGLLNQQIRGPKAPLIVQALIYAILTSTSEYARIAFSYLIKLPEESHINLKQDMNWVISRKFYHLDPKSQEQVLWLIEELIIANSGFADKLLYSVVRQIQGGRVTKLSVKLSNQLMDLVQKYRRWFMSHDVLVGSVMYTLLRLIENHGHRELQKVRERETTVMLSLLREAGWAKLGRDGIRVLFHLQDIPAMREVLVDLQRTDPSSKVEPRLMQILSTPTDPSVISSRLPPEVSDMLVQALRDHPQWSLQDITTKLLNEHLTGNKRESYAMDVVRYMLRAIDFNKLPQKTIQVHSLIAFIMRVKWPRGKGGSLSSEKRKRNFILEAVLWDLMYFGSADDLRRTKPVFELLRTFRQPQEHDLAVMLLEQLVRSINSVGSISAQLKNFTSSCVQRALTAARQSKLFAIDQLYQSAFASHNVQVVREFQAAFPRTSLSPGIQPPLLLSNPKARATSPRSSQPASSSTLQGRKLNASLGPTPQPLSRQVNGMVRKRQRPQSSKAMAKKARKLGPGTNPTSTFSPTSTSPILPKVLDPVREDYLRFHKAVCRYKFALQKKAAGGTPQAVAVTNLKTLLRKLTKRFTLGREDPSSEFVRAFADALSKTCEFELRSGTGSQWTKMETPLVDTFLAWATPPWSDELDEDESQQWIMLKNDPIKQKLIRELRKEFDTWGFRILIYDQVQNRAGFENLLQVIDPSNHVEILLQEAQNAKEHSRDSLWTLLDHFYGRFYKEVISVPEFLIFFLNSLRPSEILSLSNQIICGFIDVIPDPEDFECFLKSLAHQSFHCQQLFWKLTTYTYQNHPKRLDLFLKCAQFLCSTPCPAPPASTAGARTGFSHPPTLDKDVITSWKWPVAFIDGLQGLSCAAMTHPKSQKQCITFWRSILGLPNPFLVPQLFITTASLNESKIVRFLKEVTTSLQQSPSPNHKKRKRLRAENKKSLASNLFAILDSLYQIKDMESSLQARGAQIFEDLDFRKTCEELTSRPEFHEHFKTYKRLWGDEDSESDREHEAKASGIGTADKPIPVIEDDEDDDLQNFQRSPSRKKSAVIEESSSSDEELNPHIREVKTPERTRELESPAISSSDDDQPILNDLTSLQVGKKVTRKDFSAWQKDSAPG